MRLTFPAAQLLHRHPVSGWSNPNGAHKSAAHQVRAGKTTTPRDLIDAVLTLSELVARQ
jgi:hypothetical protein